MGGAGRGVVGAIGRPHQLGGSFLWGRGAWWWWGCWWWRFTKEYLRLPRAWLIASLLTLMGLLAAVAATGAIEGWLAQTIADVKYAIWKWRNA